jgi:hypothetical protein
MRPVPGDFNGDNIFDMAVYQESTGNWYIRSVTSNVPFVWGTNWGGTGMIPVPGDYNGDSRWDLAVYQEASGRWFIRSIYTNTPIVWGVQWGDNEFYPLYYAKAYYGPTVNAAGTWRVYASGHGWVTLSLSQSGTTITGRSTDSDGVSPVSGFVDGNALRISIGGGSDPARVVAYISGNILIGTYSSDGGTDFGTLSGSR